MGVIVGVFLLQDRIFDKFFEQAEIAKYSDEERQEYEASVKDYRDYINTIDTAHDKGRKEGRTAGIEETASKMKSKGFSVEDIAEVTGLTAEEIEGL